MTLKNASLKNGVRVVVLSTAIFSLGLMGCAEIPGLYSTGVDDNGDVLPVGSNELYYLYSGPVPPPAKVLGGHSNWVTPPAGSAWIGPANGDIEVPEGDYTYRLVFDLAGLDPRIASVTGAVAADNVVSILLNGVDTGFVHPEGQSSFRSLERFSIRAGFLPGMNTLEFQVNNDGIASGLLVSNLNGRAVALP
jgi:hypothetical protein